jgi:hypothetical protein
MIKFQLNLMAKIWLNQSTSYLFIHKVVDHVIFDYGSLAI